MTPEEGLRRRVRVRGSATRRSGACFAMCHGIVNSSNPAVGSFEPQGRRVIHPNRAIRRPVPTETAERALRRKTISLSSKAEQPADRSSTSCYRTARIAELIRRGPRVPSGQRVHAIGGPGATDVALRGGEEEFQVDVPGGKQPRPKSSHGDSVEQASPAQADGEVGVGRPALGDGGGGPADGRLVVRRGEDGGYFGELACQVLGRREHVPGHDGQQAGALAGIGAPGEFGPNRTAPSGVVRAVMKTPRSVPLGSELGFGRPRGQAGNVPMSKKTCFRFACA